VKLSLSSNYKLLKWYGNSLVKTLYDNISTVEHRMTVLVIIHFHYVENRCNESDSGCHSV